MPAITVAMRTEISQLYVSLFGRAPDGEGLGFWVKSYSDGNTLAKIAQSMYETAPARAYYPLFATPTEVVTTFYTNVLGRAPDAEGLAFWVKEYNASATQGAFFEKLISNVVNYNGTDAAGVTSKSLFSNKVAVAQYYGEQNGNVAGATTALNGVTAVAATVDTAKAAIVNTVASGQTFTLTTSADNFPGTAGNDTISGLQYTDSAANSTLTASDSIVGGNGVDVLNATIQNQAGTATGGSAFPVATMSGVETINIRSLSTTAADVTTIAASNYTGVTAVNADRSINAVTITGLGAGASAGMIGNGAVLNGALNLAYTTATTPVVLNISGGTLNTGNLAKIAVTTGSATTATINSTGATANAVDTIALSSTNTVTALTINADIRTLTGVISGFAAATTAATPTNTLTVAGAAAGSATAAAVGIGALDASVGTVNASGLSAGGVSFTMNATPTTFTFTGGAGQDIVTTAAAYVAGNAITINAGGGSSDRLVVGTTAHIDAASGAKYSGFEQVQAGNGASIDVSLLAANNTITAVRIADVAGSTGVTSMNATQASAVSITTTGINSGASQTSGITLGIAGASGVQVDTVTAAVTNTSSTGVATNAFLNGITLTGIENLVLTTTAASASGAGHLSFDATNATSLGSLKVTTLGSAYLNFNDATGTNFSFDGASSSGPLTVVASAYTTTTGAAINGGSGNDTIFGTARGDVINGGAGNDLIFLDAVTAAGEIQTFTMATNNATAGATITIGGVATTIGDTATTTEAATAIATNAAAIMAANTNIQSITSNTAVVTITFKTHTGDVALLASSDTSGAMTVTGAEGTAGIVVTATGTATAHAAADTVTGGAGNDTFHMRAGGTIDLASTITDLNLGGSTGAGAVDLLHIDAATAAAAVVIALTSAQQTTVTGTATLALAVASVLGVAGTANNVVQFTYGADTYFIHNGDGNGAFNAGQDTLIKITGVTGTLDASDITIV
jgi:hypothetical protein